MKKITKEISEKELQTILENHERWLGNFPDGRKGNLRNRDLRGINLVGCKNLRHINLSGADLSGAVLSAVDLGYANLKGANLEGAHLCMADLSGADLSGANLKHAFIDGAILSCSTCKKADFSYADMSRADLTHAELEGAILNRTDLQYSILDCTHFEGADLYKADLRNANLSFAHLEGAKNIPDIPMICPEEGEIIGWKIARLTTRSNFKMGNKYDVLVKLLIPMRAKRLSSTSRECRCNQAIVQGIYELDGTRAREKKCYSYHDPSFVYEVGHTVQVDDFDDDRWKEDAKGIYFYLNKQEAIESIM